jgi:hypothetical protein
MKFPTEVEVAANAALCDSNLTNDENGSAVQTEDLIKTGLMA